MERNAKINDYTTNSNVSIAKDLYGILNDL